MVLCYIMEVRENIPDFYYNIKYDHAETFSGANLISNSF